MEVPTSAVVVCPTCEHPTPVSAAAAGLCFSCGNPFPADLTTLLRTENHAD